MIVSIGRRMSVRGYSHLLPGVPPVFSPGDPVVVTGLDGDDAVRCCLADALGYPVEAISDTLFIEELEEG